jgi:hypothetical protein
MQTSARHRSMTTRQRHARFHFRTTSPAHAWWGAEREQAMQSTRMLSLAMLLGFAGWTTLLLVLLVWFVR